MVDPSTTFTGTVTADENKRLLVPLPFDPDEAWGTKQAHRVHGTVVLAPEGPQRDDLAPDIAAALAAEPQAGAFFDSLAQFYRRAYLRWIDGTKRRPAARAERIVEMIELLKAGIKERPRTQVGA